MFSLVILKKVSLTTILLKVSFDLAAEVFWFVSVHGQNSEELFFVALVVLALPEPQNICSLSLLTQRNPTVKRYYASWQTIYFFQLRFPNP